MKREESNLGREKFMGANVSEYLIASSNNLRQQIRDAAVAASQAVAKLFPVGTTLTWDYYVCGPEGEELPYLAMTRGWVHIGRGVHTDSALSFLCDLASGFADSVNEHKQVLLAQDLLRQVEGTLDSSATRIAKVLRAVVAFRNRNWDIPELTVPTLTRLSIALSRGEEVECVLYPGYWETDCLPQAGYHAKLHEPNANRGWAEVFSLQGLNAEAKNIPQLSLELSTLILGSLAEPLLGSVLYPITGPTPVTKVPGSLSPGMGPMSKTSFNALQ